MRLFLDCRFCDMDFLRTEITFVSYMRDQHDADLYVLVTTQGTGGGGTEYTLNFMGQGRLAGRSDTVRYVSRQTDTEDETRRGLAKVLKLGLVRYVMGTEAARRMDVSFEPPTAQAAPREQRDPWNYWVFRLGMSGNFSGEKSQTSSSINGSVRATRTTERSKMSFSASGNSRRSRYDIDSVTSVTSRNERYNANALIVRSLGPHWSLGGTASAGSSTFSNQRLRLKAAPAIEYDVFPYSQSTRRSLTFNYSIGYEYTSYTDTTIFDQIRESHPMHNLSIGLSSTEPWGNAYLSISASQYLHDLSKKSVNFFGNFEVRIIRGLSMNFFGGYDILRDQLYLPKGGASAQDILLQRQQLATGYSYFTGIGLSYSFGSIYNNVVNPRFGGGGRTFFFSN